MKQLFWKISLIILLIACLILAIDKTRMGLRMERVSSQIAERSKESRETIQKYQKLADEAKLIANQQKNLFHIVTYSDLKEHDLPQQLAEQGREAFMVREIMTHLPPEKRTPAAVLTEVQKYWLEKQEKDKWHIHPETGTVQTLYASVLEETARNCGFTVQTKFYWQLPDFKLTTQVILQNTLTQEKAVSAEKPFGECVEQAARGTMLFPFAVKEINGNEQEFFRQTGENRLPLGRYYVHIFRHKGTEAWLLDYELKEENRLKEINLRGFSLLPGSEIRSVANGAVRTFRITPDANGESFFMIFADSPVFVRRITGIQAKDRLSLPGKKAGEKE